MKPFNLDDSILFSVRNIEGKECKLNFDDIDFIIKTTELNFPRIFPNEPHSDTELQNPSFRRNLALEVTNSFIPELKQRILKELKCELGIGVTNALYKKYQEYVTSLKKNMVDDTSLVPSTDLIAPTSPTNDTTSSL